MPIDEEIKKGDKNRKDEIEDEEAETQLPTITISLTQLCQKLKKINAGFNYEITNENDDWSPDHVTAELSSAKL